jgi:homoserine kinase
MNERTNMAKQNHSRKANARAFEVRVPASTSNLGAGFDCFGLALQLYLTVSATVAEDSTLKCNVRFGPGKENANLPRTAENLIYRAMVYAARREGVSLPPVDLVVDNEIPISRGLGSSAAAIVAGIKLCELLCECPLSNDKVLHYATEFEGHADNVAASLLGGFVVTCISRHGEIVVVRRDWPQDIHVVVVAPNSPLETRLARAALPRHVNHVDAVFNLQRAALFNAALSEHRYDLLWEAMQDHLHQEKRQTLMPGLAEALATPQMPGQLGLALSGAGPSVLALVEKNFEQIGESIARSFRQRGLDTTVRQLEIDNTGCRGRVLPRAQRSARGRTL